MLYIGYEENRVETKSFASATQNQKPAGTG